MPVATLPRRAVLGMSVAALAAPHVARAQASTLRISGWGGKWAETLRAGPLPAFEKAHNCKVELDTAFPFIPKLQASARNAPVYDVLHANSNEMWLAATEGLVQEKLDPKLIPNLSQVFPYAVSDRIAGVCIFTSATGLAYRTDRGHPAPTSWKDFADRRYDGQRGSQNIVVNTLAQSHLMLLGQLYGAGMQDLDAAYKALEAMRPMKVVDFAGQMERLILTGEASIGLLHDAGVRRYDGQNQPIAFAAPKEGVLALEQVLSITTGTKMGELASAWINHLLDADVQRVVAGPTAYGPANRNTQLDAANAAWMYSTPERVAQLIQVDWKWYNARKDAIDARVARILRG